LKKAVATKGLARYPGRMIPTTGPADKIIMQGVHVELTPALQQAIRDKFAVLLRHNEHIVRIHVRLQLEQTHGRQHLYSATAQIEIGGPDLVATMKGDEAYAVIDALAEKLSEQLRERHERRTERRRDSGPIDAGS
jgi:putative sigma-54 modulation protein